MIDLQPAIDALNSALEADPTAVEAILYHEVPCNDALADHATVVVGGPIGDATVRAMGLFNGAFRALTGRAVAFQEDDKTGRVVGFCVFIDQPDT